MDQAEKIAAIAGRIHAVPALEALAAGATADNIPFVASEIADALNALDPAQPTRRIRVTTSTARAVLLASGEWANIVMGCDPGNVAQIRALCITVRDALMLQPDLATDDAATYQVITNALAGLVAGNLLQSGTRGALLALAEQLQSWAMATCGEPVQAREVAGWLRGGGA